MIGPIISHQNRRDIAAEEVEKLDLVSKAVVTRVVQSRMGGFVGDGCVDGSCIDSIVGISVRGVEGS